ncbi:MAG: hypothetical protein ACRDM1_08315, partial [Gaiellaceae bacterium]
VLGSAAEVGGGALLAAGLATPLAATTLTSVMLTAIRKVHFKNGLWNGNGGYELNAVLIAALLALVDVGPGEWSLDAVLGSELRGPRWAAATLAAAAVGSAAVIASSSPAPPAASAAAVATEEAEDAEDAEDAVPERESRAA